MTREDYLAQGWDFPWHEDCEKEFRHIGWEDGFPYRAYWCPSHNQWTYQRPVSATFLFADGAGIAVHSPMDRKRKR